MTSTDRTNTGRATAVALTALLAAGLAIVPTTTATAAPEAKRAPICTSKAHPEIAKRLDQRIRQEVRLREGTISVGVSAFDGDLVCALGARNRFDAASTGKVVILGALLRTAMDEGRELTSREKELATDMITVSGNDSAVELRNQLGPERLQRFLDLAGMHRTKLHPEGYTGLMKINVRDQLTLLGVLRTENDVLGADERAYARGLMGDVIESQRWGVPTGAPAGAGVYHKNGWLPYDNTDTWRINSMGGFQDTSIGDYDIVVLTDGNDGMQYGVDSIGAVAVGVHSVLTGESLRTLSQPTEAPEAVSDGSDRA
ncbi:serine hydrolase [Nocardiopsis lambiniae]|uniref:Serine hydrolase n=1 Tax=Nocardiopsis lambiniae TaxID=3075539 RepID=A0ABU2MG46_9ACTN|nr:serine hydrolase [Nocardiopsis sp. DSM 44743]MDT0331542.1 serine hydrolase [Nocardiopsis sp. DSM 44743]